MQQTPGKGDQHPLSPVEATLAAVWCVALRLGSIGPEENFFYLGGDSLTAVRVVSLARQRGLALHLRDVMQHQTIRDLAVVAGSASATTDADGMATDAEPDAGGPVPLMPGQQEILTRGRMSPHRWDQCLLFEVDEALDPDLLAKVAILLTDRHDSLRLRFALTADGWAQTVQQAGSDYGTIVHKLDLAGGAAEDRMRAISDKAVALQEARDLANGPLLSLVTADGGAARPSYLLASLHHLIVDATSIWILFNDLFGAYQQMRDGRPVDLPSPTMPYAAWARLLSEAAHTSRVRDQEAYWREQCRPGTDLRYDHDTGPLLTGANEKRSIVLDVHRSRWLTASGRPVWQMVLTAIVMALGQPGTGSLVVDMRDHGRRVFDGEPDLSWTTGWFGNIFPVRLPLGPASPQELHAEIGRRVTSIPDHGLAYSLLRYVTDGGRPGLESPASVLLNYTGRVGPGRSDSERPVLRQILVYPDDRAASRCPVQIAASIAAEQLHIDAFFSRNRFREPTIDALAGRLAEVLRRLIDELLPEPQMSSRQKMPTPGTW
jgi:non-ribosomal peptide synthase protein (TIGR01720 family)